MTILSIENITKSYPHPSGEISVLKGANATVAKGEVIAIIGPSGSGKSTLLSLLAGLDRPTTGKIIIAGEDLTHKNEKELTLLRSKKLGIVFQQFHLMSHLTAKENVSLPLQIAGETNVDAKALEALSHVGLQQRAEHYPRELSGGENQRVAIARAMVGKPPLILADEPSGNLDVNTGKQVMDLLFKNIKENQSTLILVTHNRELAKTCDRTLTLAQGKLTEVSP